MKCNNCGANLPNNSQFCSVCGAKVDSETRWDEKEEKSFLKFIKKIIFLPITVLNLIWILLHFQDKA
ncbi:zinc-ribbon domain-containing protein [Acetitomaculum ruminis DSM 5522]|uniref:Zinc-ribbon domain-containing protein n=1 Tax=Acetitomaculum ruminis DSM 5522 TaxID=1120918 RepID=A0A1I0XIQ9_9FIRM|nr:zinc ribbon domain-containing protein [Acetitomaculum ruminis]SFB00098.1 zinc-ribbon domain-containing protein [Acetitomaculum ruminis DSM 5522]